MNRSVEWWRPEVAVDRDDLSNARSAAAPQGSDSAVPFWFLMAFTFILLLAPQQWVPALMPLRVALIAAAVAVIAHVYDRLSRQQPIVHLTREMWITFCLLGWAVLSVPFSYWPGGSLSFLGGFYLKTLAIFWLLSNVVNTTTRLRQVAWGLSLMAVPLALTGFVHFISGVFIPEGMTVGTKRIVGYDAPLTMNPNDLALMLNLILPLCAALFLSTPRPLVRALLLAMIGLDAMAVILTFSRAGFLTLAMIATTYLWKLRKRPGRGWVWAALVVALACLPLLPSAYWDRLSTITNIEEDQTGSAQVRLQDTVTAVNLVLKNPITGTGIGLNVLALNAERGATWNIVHNAYLEHAVELGIPGLVLFLILFASCIKNASLVRQRSAPVPAFRELFCLAEGIQISLFAFGLAAVFHPVAYHFYFYYFAGLSIAAKAAYEAEAGNAASDQIQSSPQKPHIPYPHLGERDGHATKQN
jgi:O-antigen ligase/polysaccharide polymerase Wzy-like membrane protein